jgi:hypothetical protein
MQERYQAGNDRVKPNTVTFNVTRARSSSFPSSASAVEGFLSRDMQQQPFV